MTFTRYSVHAAAAILMASALAAGQNAVPAADSGRVRGESTQTRTRLAEAERKLLDGKAGDVVADLLRLLDEVGDDLITTDGKSYRPARLIAQGLLARLPAEELRTVRDRTDAPAGKLLAQGRVSRDPRPLRVLVDRHFVSRPAEDALLLLGDLAFERGEFRTAEGYWRRLLPAATADDVSYPDPESDPAAVRARVILARIFAGEIDRAATELAALKKAAPAAFGRLAGKDGPFAATLEALIARPPRMPVEATAGGDWTAFAGSSSRNGAVTGRLPSFWPSLPTWRTPIPTAGGPAPYRTRPFAAPPRACAFHPVVLGDTAYIADPARVIGFDLRTGKETVAFDFRQQPTGRGLPLPDLALPTAGDAYFTLTAADGRLYARLGSPAIAPPSEPGAKPGPTSFLVCLAPDEKTPGRLVSQWELAPPAAADGAPAAWEAAPVVSGGRVYAAVARFEGNRVVHAVAGYDDPPGRPLWVTDVCESPVGNAAEPRTRPEPLTLADGLLVFCSHTGAIAAVDAATGKPAWSYQYARSVRPAGLPSPRDLCPPVYDNGRVFAAPADADSVFALDAATGKPLWSIDGIQAEQLLGVSRGRLIVTLAGPAKGVRGFNVANGSYTEPDGWALHDDPFLRSFGRGLVSDEFVLWPTNSKHGAFALHADDGTNAAGWQTLTDARGNLAYANGVLLVATPTEVLGYVGMTDGPEERRVGKKPGNRTERVANYGQMTVPPGMPLASRRSPSDWVVPGPDLAAPVEIARRVEFPNARCVPLLPFDGEQELPGLGRNVPEPARHLVVSDGAKVYGYRPGADRPAWATDLPAGLGVTHAASHGDRLILAGPRGVAALRLIDGMIGADARFPDNDPSSSSELSSFVLAGSRVVVRCGDHHLVGIDPMAGKVAWVLDAHGRSKFTPNPIPSAPAFTSHLGSDGRFVVAQLTTGARWSVAGETGKVTAREPTSLTPWTTAPCPTPDGGLVVADGAGLVRWLADPGSGTVGWTHDAGGEASLSGRSPAVRWLNGSTLIAVSRNVGVEVNRLRRNGSGAWHDRRSVSFPPALLTDDLDLTNADADEERLYLPAGGRVTALRWNTGQAVWAVDLTAEAGPGAAEVPWAVRGGRRAVVAFPTATIPFDPAGDVLTRSASRFLSRPSADRLPAAGLSAYDAWTARTVPVLLLDPATGSLRQRLDLPATGPALAVHLSAGTNVVATAGAAYWLK